jgi:integrase
MNFRLRYIVEDVDRHGNIRIYVRVPGRRKVRIRERPGTEAFLAAYRAALIDRRTASKNGSFASLCRSYYGSGAFSQLDTSTQSWQRRALERMCEADGDKPVRLLQARHIMQRRDDLAATPGAANNLVKALKAVFKWALSADEVTSNPARDVPRLKYATTGHHSWTIDEVAQYENRHAIGTKARLAMALLLYTAGRREDAVRLGPQHVRSGRVRFTQAKNEHRSPVEVDLPLHPELAAVISATTAGHLAFLVTEYGRPFTPAGFGNKMREWCNEAGLPQCSAHGLRKAAATRLAERGATTHEIMAVTGHQTLAEAERYTRAAERKRLADSGMSKLEKGTAKSHRHTG